jgi:hypothetical protein
MYSTSLQSTIQTTTAGSVWRYGGSLCLCVLLICQGTSDGQCQCRTYVLVAVFLQRAGSWGGWGPGGARSHGGGHFLFIAWAHSVVLQLRT